MRWHITIEASLRYQHKNHQKSERKIRTQNHERKVRAQFYERKTHNSVFWKFPGYK